MLKERLGTAYRKAQNVSKVRSWMGEVSHLRALLTQSSFPKHDLPILYTEKPADQKVDTVPHMIYLISSRALAVHDIVRVAGSSEA